MVNGIFERVWIQFRLYCCFCCFTRQRDRSGNLCFGKWRPDIETDLILIPSLSCLWEQGGSPKRRSISTNLHGDTFQHNWILPDMRGSGLSYKFAAIFKFWNTWKQKFSLISKLNVIYLQALVEWLWNIHQLAKLPSFSVAICMYIRNGLSICGTLKLCGWRGEFGCIRSEGSLL
jgi:hypothetical protein